MTSSERKSGYDDFAWFYARYWNEQYHGAAFPVLERILLPHLKPGDRILDVCCGTGYLARLLGERGFRVTGLDASLQMIRHGRKHAPEAAFAVAGAADFAFAPVFDSAVSTFDSLNHIVTLEGLRRTFRNVYTALKPGGAFAFDMLVEQAYRRHWGDTFAIVQDDHVLVISGGSYRPEERLASCHVTMFRRVRRAWRRSDTEVTERCYSPGEIESVLSEAGFHDVSSYAAEDLGMAGRLGSGRVFYTAKK